MDPDWDPLIDPMRLYRYRLSLLHIASVDAATPREVDGEDGGEDCGGRSKADDGAEPLPQVVYIAIAIIIVLRPTRITNTDSRACGGCATTELPDLANLAVPPPDAALQPTFQVYVEDAHRQPCGAAAGCEQHDVFRRTKHVHGDNTGAAARERLIVLVHSARPPHLERQRLRARVIVIILIVDFKLRHIQPVRSQLKSPAAEVKPSNAL